MAGASAAQNSGSASCKPETIAVYLTGIRFSGAEADNPENVYIGCCGTEIDRFHSNALSDLKGTNPFRGYRKAIELDCAATVEENLYRTIESPMVISFYEESDHGVWSSDQWDFDGMCIDVSVLNPTEVARDAFRALKNAAKKYAAGGIYDGESVYYLLIRLTHAMEIAGSEAGMSQSEISGAVRGIYVSNFEYLVSAAKYVEVNGMDNGIFYIDEYLRIAFLSAQQAGLSDAEIDGVIEGVGGINYASYLENNYNSHLNSGILYAEAGCSYGEMQDVKGMLKAAAFMQMSPAEFVPNLRTIRIHENPVMASAENQTYRGDCAKIAGTNHHYLRPEKE